VAGAREGRRDIQAPEDEVPFVILSLGGHPIQLAARAKYWIEAGFEIGCFSAAFPDICAVTNEDGGGAISTRLSPTPESADVACNTALVAYADNPPGPALGRRKQNYASDPDPVLIHAHALELIRFPAGAAEIGRPICPVHVHAPFLSTSYIPFLFHRKSLRRRFFRKVRLIGEFASSRNGRRPQN
jgi:hypothetical protein